MTANGRSARIAHDEAAPNYRWSLYALSVVVGAVAGLGAVAFRGLIAVVHNLFFLGRFSWSYDANAHLPASPWGAFVILVPVAGAFGVAFLVKNFAPEAKGHGVPEVMDATYYHEGIIRPVVAVIKALASALSIGTGGSVGREGPIIQIGAAFGSTVGRLIAMPRWKRITLVAAGAGGGIAATFNTPIGGILFAIELILHEVSVRTLVPVGIATITATYIGRYFFGLNPSFVISPLPGSDVHVDESCRARPVRDSRDPRRRIRRPCSSGRSTVRKISSSDAFGGSYYRASRVRHATGRARDVRVAGGASATTTSRAWGTRRSRTSSRAC